jgi:hypothetical protein
MPLQSDAIWLPGVGMLSFSEKRVAEAVQEYDPDLMLGQRRDTGEWCCFLPGNRASEGQPFPVFTFGTELPHPDDAKKRLAQFDVRRQGRKIMDDIEAHFDREQKKFKNATTEATERVAEAIDSNMRMKGVHPFPKVYLAPKYGGGRVRTSG